MAKALRIEDLDCQKNASEGVLKVLSTRTKEVIDFCNLALEKGEDAEVIHDLRVSIRRLRSAIRDFSSFLDRKRVKPLRKELKTLAFLLGSIRDRDVACEILEKLKQKAEDEKIISSISSVIDEERSLRKQSFEVFQRDLSEKVLRVSRFSREVKVVNTQLSFFQVGRQVISANLEGFLLLSESLYNPFEVDLLHEFRIASKRLRYSIELFSVCYQEEKAQLFASQIAKMQGFLGELHDADVWIEELSRRIIRDEIEKRSGVWVLSEFTKKRGQSYRKALCLWSDWIGEDFIGNLRKELLG